MIGNEVLDDIFALLQNRPFFQAICPGYLWARVKRWFLSRVQRLAGPRGDRGFLSRVEPPTRTKGPPFVPVGGSTRDKRAQPFYPGWCYQPGQKAPPRDSSKGSYSIQSHVYYLGELVRKPCAR